MNQKIDDGLVCRTGVVLKIGKNKTLLMLEREGQTEYVVGDGRRLVKVNVHEILSGIESEARRRETGGNVTNIYVGGNFDGNLNVGDGNQSIKDSYNKITSAKLDPELKQTLKHLYAPSAKVVSGVDVPPLNFIMLDGQGDPNTAPEYPLAVEALYALAYAIKFHVKKSPGGVDFAVMPLEGLWWTDDMRQFSVDRKGDWKWTMMILQPEPVSAELVASQQAATFVKKRLPALQRIRFETYHEGPSAQLMHIGPYATEAPNIARIHDFIASQGHALRGKHHEIYLSDPRKAAPEKMKTVIRQPFA